MSTISDLTNGPLGNQIISGISQKTGVSTAEAQQVVSNAVPALLGALKQNASSGTGANGILQAISSNHDGSILNNLSSLFSSDDTDGNNILKHILGGQQQNLASGLSAQTGVSSANVSKILAVLAPIVMGYLGKSSKEGNVSSGGGLNDLLGGLLGGNSAGSTLGSLLDQNGDGKLDLNDVSSIVGGFFGKTNK